MVYAYLGLHFIPFAVQLYIKYAVDNVEVKSNWGRVFYTNLWATFILLGMTAYLDPFVLTRTSW